MSFHRRTSPVARTFARRTLFSLAVLVGLVAAAATLGAQQEERPITFDSAQRMTALTPFLVERLKLQPPAWPVSGAFREAKLYAVGDAQVLVVQRADGTLIRYPLDAAGAQALRAAVETGMRVSGNPAGEPEAYKYTEMAGSRFARRQLILGPILYGPLMASLATNGDDATMLYLLGSGLPALVSVPLAGESVTRAQADLAMDAAPRFALLSSFTYRAFGGDREDDGHAITVLAGSLGATAGGMLLGRGLTDGEARGMISGSNYALSLTATTMAATGAFHEACVTDYSEPYTYERSCTGGTSPSEFAALTAAALVGYPLGLQYVRRAPYIVTAGDMRSQTVISGVGALLGAAAAGNKASNQGRWAGVTGGIFLGMLAGDRLLVKPFDYTRGQGGVLFTSAAAGGLLGLALPAGGESNDDAVYFASAGLGAALGAVMAHQVVNPKRGAQRGVLRDASRGRSGDERLASGTLGGNGASGVTHATSAASAARDDARPRVQWQVDPAGLALTAAKAPGRHGILSITF